MTTMTKEQQAKLKQLRKKHWGDNLKQLTTTFIRIYRAKRGVACQ